MRVTAVFILVLLAYSCNQKTNTKVDFTVETFHSINNVVGELYQNDNLVLANPRWLKYHPDSFLVVSELNSGSKFIKIIDLKDGSIQEQIPSGRGPGEMITAWGLGIVGKKIWVFDGQLRKFCILEQDEYRKFSIQKEFSLIDKSALGACMINDSLIACLSGLGDKNRLTFYNSEGKFIKKLGEIPSILNNNQISADNLIFMSSMANIENSKIIVLACVTSDLFEIYNFDKGMTKRIVGPIGIELTAKEVDVGIGFKTVIEPKYSTYYNVAATDTAIWISYSGYRFNDSEKRIPEKVFPKKIFSFSEEGEPNQILKFQNNMLYFDVDWNNEILYSLEIEDEIPVVKIYTLDNIKS